MKQLPELPSRPDAAFPTVDQALVEPNGLLAWGGDLSTRRLLNAYRHGIFPWFSEGDPILWWSPDPRCVFETADFRLHRRDARALAKQAWTVSADHDFEAVLAACAEQPRRGQPGIWITREMRLAYCRLHQQGHAHSIEVRDEQAQLVGGLYGVSIGRVFFGESMVSLRSGGSKLALAALCLRLRQWGFPLLDAQVESTNLLHLGARSLPRQQFAERLHVLTAVDEPVGHWRQRFGLLTASQVCQR